MPDVTEDGADDTVQRRDDDEGQHGHHEAPHGVAPPLQVADPGSVG